MKALLVICCSLLVLHAAAQQGNGYVREGNGAYRNGDYKLAAGYYQKALGKDPGNSAALFNLGNSLQRQQDAANAIKQYDEVLSHEKDAGIRAAAYNNKALALVKQNDTDGAIDAFKHALGLAPEDNDIRENLQKAINDKKQKEQKQQQNKKPPQKNKPQPPKLANRQMMEQKFNELRNQEKQLQKQLQKKQQDGQPEKDW
jgi:Ca-activated chloride channel family protein